MTLIFLQGIRYDLRMYLRSRKRSLSLEVFVLAMIDRGVSTPYDLRERAALSVGASIPALRRLEKEGQVAHTVSGRRHEYSLTAAGRRRLRTSWQQDLDRHEATDFDGVLRTAYLSWLLGGPQHASRFLSTAARARRRTAESRREASLRLMAEFQADPDGNGFAWMKETAEAARARTDAATLSTIRRELGRRTPSKTR